MLTIKQYLRPQTLDEAYELCQKRTNAVIGGMLWLKMQSRSVNTAIDLCDLGLDYIQEEVDSFRIGAMVSLRQLEKSPELNAMTQNAFSEAVKHIVGVQFRNSATIGGSIYGRFGFSDVITLLQSLDTKVHLHHQGMMSLTEFIQLPKNKRDILVEIIVPKKAMKVRYLTQRNTATDFPVVACAVSCIDGTYRCAVGARPGTAVLLTDDNKILADGIAEESAERFGKDIASRTVFGSNMRGSAEYRKQVCAVLVRRAVMMMKED